MGDAVGLTWRRLGCLSIHLVPGLSQWEDMRVGRKLEPISFCSL